MNERIDPGDTSRCPLGVRCEACGTEDGPLGVRPVGCAVGVLCMTVCARCAPALERMAPPVAVGTAERLVMQHARHIGAV